MSVIECDFYNEISKIFMLDAFYRLDCLCVAARYFIILIVRRTSEVLALQSYLFTTRGHDPCRDLIILEHSSRWAMM